ncbi:hypothetical protein C5613_17490 [Rhodococcus opacus]|uniref:HTH tetR-type domain-containing protein n=2 Tax=Rhodococcus opacus TaxID=37919 RepID=A0A2S8J959_RHOOP|nr:hypothetical protein C5613_17490 [Rhodococcus opacus]
MVGDSNGHEQRGREICKVACTVEEGGWHPGASDVRSRMSEAGQDLFSRHGYGITLLQVIDQAGTPRGSIYYHFHDAKEELAIEVMSRVATALEKLVASVGRRKTEPTEFLQALVDHHTKRFGVSEYHEGRPIAGVTVSSSNESDELKHAIGG